MKESCQFIWPRAGFPCYVGPVYIGSVSGSSNLVALLQRSRSGKFFCNMKKLREKFKYMTTIIFLDGNLNRQQDILESCRRGPGPNEHANIVQTIFAEM